MITYTQTKMYHMNSYGNIKKKKEKNKGNRNHTYLLEWQHFC